MAMEGLDADAGQFETQLSVQAARRHAAIPAMSSCGERDAWQRKRSLVMSVTAIPAPAIERGWVND